MVCENVIVSNPSGLHLRPVGLFCKTAMRFNSRITLEKESGSGKIIANAKSVLSVLGACVNTGDKVLITCEGADEEEALEGMITILKDGLGE